MNKNDIRDLYIHAFKGTSPATEFSVKDVKETLRAELKALAPNKYEYEKNKLEIFQIVQEAFDEVLPDYVGNFIGQFAEIKSVPNGQRASFIVKRGRRRAKTFVTEVGLAGVYEAFRLDVDTFEVSAKAYGGAAYIDFERTLDGSEDLVEPLQLLLDGLQEAIYRELLKALITATQNSDMPTANIASTTNFDPAEMQRLCTIAKNYGGGNAVIFATPEFVQEMGPDAIGMPIYGPYALTASPTAGSAPGYSTPVYNPNDIASIAATGYITMFRGTPIVQLPQAFTDENNDTYQVPPQYAFIFPAGNQKIIKVVFEGDTDVRDWQHRDRQMEIEIYKKFGVAILTTNDWCVYENQALATLPSASYNNNLNPHDFAPYTK
mgnify:FL=1|nr:MAG TPA: major capsid protein [Caudoviricetes sp.]